jgi:hypothetical protein
MRPFVNKVTVKDDMELFDEIMISVGALQVVEAGQKTNLVDTKFFRMGGLLRVDMGYGNSLNTVGAGHIVKVNPKFGRGGISLEITAYDPFFQMKQTKHPESIKSGNVRWSQVVKTVLGRHKFVGNVEINVDPNNDVKKEYTQDSGKNDYEFLRKFCNIRGFDFFNRYNPKTGKFDFFLLEPIDNQEPKFTFSYFEHDDNPLKTLLDFSVEIDMADQVTDLEIVSFDRTKREKIVTFISVPRADGGQDIQFVSGGAGKPLPKLSGGQVRFKAFGRNIQVLRTKPFKNPGGEKEAKIFATMWLRQLSQKFFKGSGTLIGVEFLQSRAVVEFLGIGNQYSGKWFLDSVQHDMSDGAIYTTKVAGRKILEDPIK